MSLKKWKYQKAQGHHHVVISKDEVLDVNSEKNARLISMVPELVEFIETTAWSLMDHPEVTKLYDRIQKIKRLK